jgi:acyl-CoA reductase-like NAD-dependent aldehyde dehydrogenase
VGAVAAAGCMGPADPTPLTAFFLEPTVSTEAKPGIKIWREQVFGSAVYPVITSEEAMLHGDRR